jgi:erythronate-4-phosphate dehydrogenase
MKIIVDDGVKSFKEIIRLLRGFDSIEFEYLNSVNINSDILKNVDILIVRSTVKVNKLLLDKTKIKLVCSATAGKDHIDENYLKSKDINWFHCPGSNAESVVNYVMSAIQFLHEKGIFQSNNRIGIIGYGNIGSKLKRALDCFSFKNYVYDPFLEHDFLVNLKKIQKCDLISIHVPLTFDTNFPTSNLIDKSFLMEMSSKTLINTSRGGVVNEQDLIELKKINYISDVWLNEPIPSKEIIDYSLISTPHIAGHSFDGKINGTIKIINDLQNFLEIEKFNKIFNIEVLSGYLNNNKLDYQGDLSLESYKSNYDIETESNKFKKDYKHSDNKLSVFLRSRANHFKRRDIKLSV